jgi:hypothetical protein
LIIFNALKNKEKNKLFHLKLNQSKMDDYIFLLIAVALSIFGAINQNKKKKNLTEPLPEKTAKPRNFLMDQLLGEDFLSGPPVEVKPIVTVRPEMKREPLTNPMSVDKSGLYHTAFASTLPDRTKNPLQPSLKKQTVNLTNLEDEDEEMTGYLEDFSLRKAFVYSEILQRKY